MKTAISLPDDLFALADHYARTHGLSRSELYATALRDYLEERRDDNLTEEINRACADLNTALSDEFARATRHRLLESEW